jgi:hypothetical protein
LAALLPVAMRLGTPLSLPGPVSQRLMRNADHIQRILSSWRRDLRPVSVAAAGETNRRFDARNVGCFFTGGVDSFYTLLKNLEFERGEKRITHLLYVRGFDVPLTDAALGQEVERHLAEAARSLELPLIVVSCNLRHLSYRWIPWGRVQHGAALASVALCFRRFFRRIYVAASVVYDSPAPWGSHPLLDPLWSTESLEIVHDGCEASRAEKIQWQVARSAVALDHLRVCSENRDGRYNCGRCEKCQRTMIGLHAVGQLGRCRTLPDRLDTKRIARLAETHPVFLEYLRDTLRVMQREGRDPLLQSALEAASARATSRGASIRAWLRRRYPRS